jgi:hypothetical protein
MRRLFFYLYFIFILSLFYLSFIFSLDLLFDYSMLVVAARSAALKGALQDIFFPVFQLFLHLPHEPVRHGPIDDPVIVT